MIGRSVSIAAGLPYTVLLNFFCVALWRAVKKDAGDMSPDGPTWYHDIFDIFTWKRLMKTGMAIVAPWFFIGRAEGRLSGNPRPLCMWMTLAIVFYGFIGLLIGEAGLGGLMYLAWPLYVGFAIMGTGVRSSIREKFQMEEGNMAEDFFAILIMYPMAAVQMDEHMEHADAEDYRKKNDDYGYETARPIEEVQMPNNPSGIYPMSDLSATKEPYYHHVTDNQGSTNPAFISSEKF